MYYLRFLTDQKKKIPFKFESTYIERTVDEIKNKQNISLIDAVEKNRLNILLGVGGLGKTTEINYLAHKLSNFKNCYCFVIRLIKYANSLDELLDAFHPNWKNVPDGFKTFLIFDGLDEVSSLKFDIASKEVELFATKNSGVSILVTCRTNFNPLYSGKEKSNENDEFTEILLNEINETDIESFILKECNSPKIFLQAAEKSKIVEIFKNPFYLVNSVEIFNSQNIIPENKSDFYTKLIDQRIRNEEKRLSFKHNVNECNLKEGLKLLALTMQYSGKNEIEKIDFDRIIRSRDTSENIKRIFFHEVDNVWQFEHNNFQEFLAAEAISELGWETITKIILLPNKKLKPKWLNAFSFLVNLVAKNNLLITWFVENEIESLIKVEPGKIEDKIKNQIFKRLFEKHKKDETIIWRLSYSTKNLYHFIQLETNREIKEFLINELKTPESNIQSISNAVHLLEELENPGIYKSEIQTIYLKLLTNNYHKYGIAYSIFNSFSKWKMFDNELKNKIITIDNLFVKEGPISSLCHYLEDGKFTDITADIIFRIILSMQENHVVGTEFALYKVLELLSSYELSSLIQKLTPTDFKDHTRIWIRDLYKYLNSQAIELFQKDSQLVSAITDFVYASFVYHDEEYAKEFKSFFEKTNQVFASFQLCFLADLKSKKIKRREFFTLPAMIADQQCLDWVIDYYLKNTFSDEMMWNFLISLNFVGNYDGRSYFINKINKSTQGKFEPPPNPWEVFNKEKDKLYLKTLLDKELALRFINKAFDVFGKDNIERTEIIKKQFDKEDRYEDVELNVGLELISRHSKDKINIKKFINWISKKEEWNYVVLDEYYHRITSRNLPKENINWIRNWCEDYKQKTQIKNAITIKKDGAFSYLNIVRFFIKYAMFLDISLSEEQFLELTSFLGLLEFRRNINNKTTEIKLYDYIRKNIKVDKIKQRIFQNIEEGKLVSYVLVEHVNIIEKEGWQEGTELLIKHLINPKLSRYEKDSILRLYKTYNGNTEELVPALEYLNFKGDDTFFDWNLIDFMIEEKNAKTIEYLINKIEDNDIDQLKLGIYLLLAQRTIAFEVITKNLRLFKNHNENEFLTNTINQLSCKNFSAKILSNFLIEILEIYIVKGFGTSGFNNLLPLLFIKLFEIITETEIDGSIVINSITKILDSSEKNETNKRARYELYELENKVNIHMDKGCQIKDAILELKKLGIEYEF